MKRQQRNTVIFIAHGKIRLTVRVRPEESHADAAHRVGIRLGSRNSIDGTVRLADYDGYAGEVRFN